MICLNDFRSHREYNRKTNLNPAAIQVFSSMSGDATDKESRGTKLLIIEHMWGKV